ncbi:MAG: CDP-2,3-bis-(O-geranylgeranyl)-sn-glycerol synthase [Candidatus Diapherotrites archaeon]|nr:CDP-2,3-bis-(O-geranylgeranyl)-sn-glycerol synthase [Candidatus Diapherotrites archaeon]
MLIESILRVCFFAIPLYIANSAAMGIGGKTPLDKGKKINGKRILGDGKTTRGTFFAILTGILAVVFVSKIVPSDIFTNYVLIGSLATIGAISGDMIGSFMKRQIGIQRGGRALGLDQLDFILGAYLFVLPVYIPTLLEAALLIVPTIVFHSLANLIAYKIKMKNVPW